MIRKAGYGCIAIAVLAAALLFGLSQTELGQWLFGIVLVYGGAMFAGAVAHETVTGEVIALKRLDPPTDYSAGSISFSFEGDDGNIRKESRRVMYSTSKFRAVAVGDPIDVWVCENDRTKVKLVGYSTYEPEKCFEKAKPAP